MLLLCLAITACVVAWGFLVLAAIDFGSTARGGQSEAWAHLALACVGAAACLFVGMILIGKVLRATGIIADPGPPPGPELTAQTAPPTEPTRASQPSTGPQGEPSTTERAAAPTTAGSDLRDDIGDTAERPAVPDLGDTAERPAVQDIGDTAERPAVRDARAKGGKRAAR